MAAEAFKAIALDPIDFPIFIEYAQLRAGNLVTYAAKQEDVIQLKREVPAINLHASNIASSMIQNVIFGRRTPVLRDERVRLAFQMSYDRETWIRAICLRSM